MYLDVTQVKDEIICWLRDTEGTLHKMEFPAPFYCYVTDPNGKYRSLFGNNVSKKSFKNQKDYFDYTNRMAKTHLWESDISPIYKFLSDNFYNRESQAKVNIGYFDIEVKFDKEKGFPSYTNAYGEVNSIALFDKTKDEYHLFMLTDDKSIRIVDEKEGKKVNLYHCVTERQLLDTFFYIIEDIDVLSGWHSEGFDIPYLHARAKKIYGMKGYTKLCRDGFRAKEVRRADDYGNEVTHVTLTGRAHLDLLELYKKFTFGERENYRLDTIGKLEVGESKLEYDGDLGSLYDNDPVLFFKYNLHDARLLKMIDGKMKLIELAVAMARNATIKFNDIFGSIKYLEHSIRNYSHFDREEIIILPDKNPDNVKKSFPGAFVLDTKPGVYGWTQSIDLASLYPSVIRSINISPETHLLQCEGKHKDFIKIVEGTDDLIKMKSIQTRDYLEYKANEVREFLRVNDLTISANGSIFMNEEGLIPEVLGIWYTERARTKKLSKQYAKDGDKDLSVFYDMRQNLMKLSLNSLYGAISNPYSRFYSVDLAASVTLTGQEIEKFQIYKADTIVKDAISGTR